MEGSRDFNERPFLRHVSRVKEPTRDIEALRLAAMGTIIAPGEKRALLEPRVSWSLWRRADHVGTAVREGCNCSQTKWVRAQKEVGRTSPTLIFFHPPISCLVLSIGQTQQEAGESRSQRAKDAIWTSGSAPWAQNRAEKSRH